MRKGKYLRVLFFFCLCAALPITAFSVHAQDSMIQPIPPAMNLLVEIPIAQSTDASPAQTTPNQPSTQPSTQQSHSKADTAQLPATEIFTGTISKGSNGYFLKDAHGTSYRLDDAARAAPYKNKAVEITGRLELDTNLIHVGSIQPAH